jgi:hypothetical protein
VQSACAVVTGNDRDTEASQRPRTRMGTQVLPAVPASLTHRTQEVGGSSPPSSIDKPAGNGGFSTGAIPRRASLAEPCGKTQNDQVATQAVAVEYCSWPASRPGGGPSV